MQFKVVILHKTVYTCLNFLSRNFLSRKFNAWKIPWCNVLKLNSNYDMRSCVESWIRLHLSARWIQPFPNRNPELSRLLCDVMRKTHPFNAKMHGQALVLALRKNIQRERGWRSIKPLTHHRSSNSVGKKVPHQNYRNSLNDIQWIQWIITMDTRNTVYTCVHVSFGELTLCKSSVKDSRM